MLNKYYLFDLQLFADAEGGENGAEVETPETLTDDQPEEKAKPQPKYTDDDVDKLINRKFAEWQKTQEKKTSEAERLAKMTAEEKADVRIKQLEEKLAAAERKEAVADMTKQARAIFNDAKLNISDEILVNLIADDADTTKAAVNSFIALFKSEVDKAVKEAYKGETPRKGGGTPGLTAEKILAVTNKAERQRLIAENMHLFKN